MSSTLSATKQPEIWGDMRVITPPALGEAWFINFHNLRHNIKVVIYGDATYLSWMANDPVLTDTSAHQPQMHLWVPHHATRLLIAAIELIVNCPAVYDGKEMHQRQLAARGETVMVYWLSTLTLTIWALPDNAINTPLALVDGPESVAGLTHAGVGQKLTLCHEFDCQQWWWRRPRSMSSESTFGWDPGAARNDAGRVVCPAHCPLQLTPSLLRP